MDTLQALVEAMRREPQERLHKLVYADWLEEQGRQREAEYVRLFSLPHAAWFSRDLEEMQSLEAKRVSLKAVEKEIVNREPLSLLLASKNQIGYRFCRGVLDVLYCDAALWLKHGKAVRAAHPVTQLGLWECQEISPKNLFWRLELFDGMNFLGLFGWPESTEGYRWLRELRKALSNTTIGTSHEKPPASLLTSASASPHAPPAPCG